MSRSLTSDKWSDSTSVHYTRLSSGPSSICIPHESKTAACLSVNGYLHCSLMDGLMINASGSAAASSATAENTTLAKCISAQHGCMDADLLLVASTEGGAAKAFVTYSVITIVARSSFARGYK